MEEFVLVWEKCDPLVDWPKRSNSIGTKLLGAFK